MKNNKAPEEDEISIEAIKLQRRGLPHALKTLFNEGILDGTTSDQWNNAIFVLMHKKGYITNVGNYQPISLL